MKRIITLAILTLIVSTAQAYDSRIQGRPDGATGPGVQFTQKVVGRIIGIGSPIVKNIPVGQQCYQQPYQQQENRSSLNTGSVLGAIAGGVIGNQIGKGNGRTVATAIGAATGAIVGDNINQNEYRPGAYQQQNQGGCETIFEQRIIGWTFTAEYQGLQMQGMSHRQPQLGDEVQVYLTSIVYAGE